MPLFSFKPTAVFTIAALLFSLSSRAATTALWDGAIANWSDALHWSTTPFFPNNGGGSVFDAVVNAGTVTLNQEITIERFTLSGGTLAGALRLSANAGLEWTGGTIESAGLLEIGGTSQSTIAGGSRALVLRERTLDFTGLTTFSTGTIRGGFGATIDNRAGAIFTVLNQAAFFADSANPGYKFDNVGTFTARATSAFGFTSMDAQFDNTGTVRVELSGTALGHTLSLAGGGTHRGSIVLQEGTSVEFGNGTTLAAGTVLSGDGEAIVAGSVALTGSISAENLVIATGELNVGSNAMTVSASATQLGGTLRIGSGGFFEISNGELLLDGGLLTGSGTLKGGLDAQGTVAPGTALGELRITGDAAFGADARLALEIGGTAPGSHDLLTIGGSAFLGGRIAVTLANGIVPAPEAVFTVLTAAVSASGTFLNAPLDGQRLATSDGLGSFEIDYRSDSVVLTNYIPEPSAAVLILLGTSGALGFYRPRRRATCPSGGAASREAAVPGGPWSRGRS